MATHDDLYWYKNVLRKQLNFALRIYLSLAIVLSPIFLMNSANAAANLGGWSMGNPVAQGASAVYTGTKNVIINGADYIKKGTAKITPPASGVAKVLARGVAGYALSIAVEQLVGAVDWVLDPANNQVVYTKTEGHYCVWSNDYCGTTPYEACKARGKSRSGGWSPDVSSGYCKSWNSYGDVSNEFIYGTGEAKEHKIPLEVVAAQVISNANSDTDKRASAQVATMAAAADVVAEAETDSTKARPITQQLEASATTTAADAAAADAANSATGTQTKNPANPDTIDLKLEFPAFCGWAPIVCEAAQVVISFPQTLTDWWNTARSKAEEWASSISQAWASVKDWATSEPQKEDSTELDFEELDLNADEVNLSGSNTCPQDSVSFSLMGKSFSLDMPYQPVCDALSFFKPAVLLVGAVASVYIVAGVRTKEQDE